MMKSAPIRNGVAPAEQGYILVAVVFMLAMLMISLTVAAPRISRAIQRDHELETMQRGKQYTRAIQLYYHKYGTYPPNIEALVNTNGVRFLRQRYLDPMTGEDDWKPILVGQNKTPLAMGFFGQPLVVTGILIPGTTPTGGNGISGATSVGRGSGSSQGGDSSSGSSSNSFFGSVNTGASAGADPQAGADSNGDSNSASGTNPSGQAFGGAGIIGFSPGSPRKSILFYKKMNHYNEWEFLYSPLSDQMNRSNIPIVQPPLQGGAPGAPPPPPGSPAAAPFPN